MQAAAPSSRRRHARQALTTPIAVLLQGNVIRGLTRNIAESGVALAIPQSLGVGERVIVSFDSHGLMFLAVVRHQNGFLHGFEFVAPSAKQRELLKTSCKLY